MMMIVILMMITLCSLSMYTISFKALINHKYNNNINYYYKDSYSSSSSSTSSSRSSSSSSKNDYKLCSSSKYSSNYAPVYLERMVERKKIEVQSLLRRHQAADDPLVMRMSYMASECRYNVTKALKKDSSGSDNLHTMSIIVDMKRKSPTIIERRNIVEFSSVSKFSELLTRVGVDGFLVNTNDIEYGGYENDLKDTVQSVKSTKLSMFSSGSSRVSSSVIIPACIQKDIIIHPIQIAQALESGASGVLLIVAVVGADLETLLDACTIMGTEAVVEVHTPNELEFALSKGATIFLVNMWDRMSGQLFPDQAKGLANMMPMNAVAIAAGNIHSIEQVAELGFYGYDSVVLGRNIADIPDIKRFIDGVHEFRGAPRTVGFGMKGMNY